MKKTNEKLLIYDLETTGLSVFVNEIIQFAGLILINGIETERFNYFIKPEKPISYEITELTGITNNDLLNAVSIEFAINDFFRNAQQKYLKSDKDYLLMCGYNNKAFDDRFFENACRKLKDIRFYKYLRHGYDLYDYLRFEKRMNRLDIANLKLETVATHFNVISDISAYHDARYDSDVTYKLLVEIGLI